MNKNNGVSIITTTLVSSLRSIPECTMSWIQYSPLFYLKYIQLLHVGKHILNTRYVFCISQASISSLFNAAIVKAILTESIDTTNENSIEEGAVVMCPPPTIDGNYRVITVI